MEDAVRDRVRVPFLVGGVRVVGLRRRPQLVGQQTLLLGLEDLHEVRGRQVGDGVAGVLARPVAPRRVRRRAVEELGHLLVLEVLEAVVLVADVDLGPALVRRARRYGREFPERAARFRADRRDRRQISRQRRHGALPELGLVVQGRRAEEVEARHVRVLGRRRRHLSRRVRVPQRVVDGFDALREGPAEFVDVVVAHGGPEGRLALARPALAVVGARAREAVLDVVARVAMRAVVGQPRRRQTGAEEGLRRDGAQRLDHLHRVLAPLRQARELVVELEDAPELRRFDIRVHKVVAAVRGDEGHLVAVLVVEAQQARHGDDGRVRGRVGVAQLARDPRRLLLEMRLVVAARPFRRGDAPELEPLR